MAEQILVNRAAMANAANALNTHANTLQTLHQQMVDSAQRVRATWSAESQQQFDICSAQQQQAIDDIRACAHATSGAVTTASDTTFSVDRALANGFSAGGAHPQAS